MARIEEENGAKAPLLGDSYDEENGNWKEVHGKSSRTSCSPCTSKQELLESFDDGPVGVKQSDSQTILNIVSAYSIRVFEVTNLTNRAGKIAHHRTNHCICWTTRSIFHVNHEVLSSLLTNYCVFFDLAAG